MKLLFVFLASISLTFVHAQNTEAARWTPLPLGSHVVGVGYGYSFGDLLLDPLLQAENVTISAQSFGVTYLQPVKLGNKLARLDVLVPFNIADWEGLLQGVPASLNRTGFADPRLRFTVHVIGPPAVGPKVMREYYMNHPVNTTLSAAVAVSLPLGEYFPDKLINIGQNIFVITPQLGVLHQWNKWAVEGTFSLNLFTNNNNFASGKTKKQKANVSLQTHLSYALGKGYSLSTGINYGLGGQSIVNRVPNSDDRADVQLTASFGVPITKFQKLKIIYLRSNTLRDVGSNTDSFALAYAILF